uniref:2-cysteine adaptor domain-containing protein n=1 Tax=viral metagenome TaxID=1070528 RepID=A0A6C0LGE8_9ZZZZ
MEEKRGKKYRPNLFKPAIELSSSIRTMKEYKVYPMTRSVLYPGQPHPDNIIYYFDTDGNTFNKRGEVLNYKVNPEEFIPVIKHSSSSKKISSHEPISYKTIDSAVTESIKKKSIFVKEPSPKKSSSSYFSFKHSSPINMQPEPEPQPKFQPKSQPQPRVLYPPPIKYPQFVSLSSSQKLQQQQPIVRKKIPLLFSSSSSSSSSSPRIEELYGKKKSLLFDDKQPSSPKMKTIPSLKVEPSSRKKSSLKIEPSSRKKSSLSSSVSFYSLEDDKQPSSPKIKTIPSLKIEPSSRKKSSLSSSVSFYSLEDDKQPSSPKIKTIPSLKIEPSSRKKSSLSSSVSFYSLEDDKQPSPPPPPPPTKIAQLLKDKYHHRKKSSSSSISSDESSSSSKSIQKDLIYKCTQWELIKIKHPKTPYNPYSGKKIKANAVTYKNLDKHCKYIPLDKQIKIKKEKKTTATKDKELCEKWLKRKTINPVTNRKIKKEGSIYKDYNKKCNSKKEKSVTYDDICQKWKYIKKHNGEDNLINPLTNKPIKFNGPKYTELNKLCKKTTKSGK